MNSAENTTRVANVHIFHMRLFLRLASPAQFPCSFTRFAHFGTPPAYREFILNKRRTNVFGSKKVKLDRLDSKRSRLPFSNSATCSIDNASIRLRNTVLSQCYLTLVLPLPAN